MSKLASLKDLRYAAAPVNPEVEGKAEKAASQKESANQNPVSESNNQAQIIPISEDDSEIQSIAQVPFILGGKGKYVICFEKYIKYLETNGFAKYEIGKDFILVRVQNNRVSEYQIHHIKQFIRWECTPDVYDFIIENDASLFSKGKLSHLTTLPELKSIDTPNSAHFFFKDNYYVVKPNANIEIRSYDHLNTLIWKNQIVNRNPKLIEDEEELAKGEFYQLMMNISNNDRARFNSLVSGVGYLLHNYNDPSNTRAIIFVDEEIPKSMDEANGGTGKSLMGKAIAKFKTNTVELDGQKVNFNSQFTYQSIDPDTQILFVNDAQYKFDFERLFSGITEGFVVEKKHQKPFTVRGIKVIITTNYTIKGSGVSFERRKFEVEFSPYYNENRTPILEFGHRLFDEWDQSQWNYFDNLMLYCVKFYLENNLVESAKINLKQRRLLDSTSTEFYEFVKNENILLYQRYSKSELFDKYFNFCGGDYHVTKHIFTKYLVRLAKIMNWELQIKRTTNNLDSSLLFTDYREHSEDEKEQSRINILKAQEELRIRSMNSLKDFVDRAKLKKQSKEDQETES